MQKWMNDTNKKSEKQEGFEVDQKEKAYIETTSEGCVSKKQSSSRKL